MSIHNTSNEARKLGNMIHNNWMCNNWFLSHVLFFILLTRRVIWQTSTTLTQKGIVRKKQQKHNPRVWIRYVFIAFFAQVCSVPITNHMIFDPSEIPYFCQLIHFFAQKQPPSISQQNSTLTFFALNNCLSFLSILYRFWCRCVKMNTPD